MTNKKRNRVGSEAQYGPRLAGEILHDYLENSNEPMAVAYREQTTKVEEQGWHPNTHLSVNLKTLLRSDNVAKAGKSYSGMLRRDVECEEFNYDDHFSFVETVPPTAGKRNPHVYEGDFITVTRKDDGSYRPNFKPMKVDKDFTVAKYATGVANELLWALEGPIKKSE